MVVFCKLLTSGTIHASGTVVGTSDPSLRFELEDLSLINELMIKFGFVVPDVKRESTFDLCVRVRPYEA